MPRLTDPAVKALKPHPSKVVRLWDGDGLHIECRPTGSKLWIFKFSIAGHPRRMSFGTYPAVTLKEARERRDDARRLLRDGIDPQRERVRLKRQQVLALGATLQAVTEEWLADKHHGWTSAYAEDTRRAFTLHVFPRLGSRPIAEIEAIDLLDLLRSLTAAGSRRELARRLRQKLELIWNYAIITGRATVNVAAPLKGQFAAPDVKGFPAVAERDLPALLMAVRGYGNVWIEGAVLLQVLTATRPGETRGARWDELDEAAGIWTIPADRMKKRRAHVVPLSSQAQQVLTFLRPVSGHLPLLFPSRSRSRVPMSENTVSACLQRVGFGHVTPHGFRKTFSTAANEAGHRSDVIEACLAHVDANKVRAVYNQAEHLKARRELLQWWGDRVERGCDDYISAKGLAPIFPLQPLTTNAGNGHERYGKPTP
jgi:integrase